MNGDNMTAKTNGRYDTEFKKMIVSKYDNGETVLDLCKDFNLKEGTVYPWITQYSNKGARGNAAKETREFSNDDFHQMQKELREIKQENEVLKKCISIFSKK